VTPWCSFCDSTHFSNSRSIGILQLLCRISPALQLCSQCRWWLWHHC
jgi:hypothetical protein